MAEIVTYPTYEYDYKYEPIVVDTTIKFSTDGSEEGGDSKPPTIAEMFADLTKNTTIEQDEVGHIVRGEGVFDDFMETAYKHLTAQFLSNRIKQEDYANSFLQMYTATLQMFSQSVIQLEIEMKRLQLQAAIESKQLEVQLAIENKRLEVGLEQSQEGLESAERQNQARIDAQQPLSNMQVLSEKQKANLYRRQIEGFDEDFLQKTLKINMDAWAVGFSVARDSFEAEGIPGPMQKGTIDTLYNSYIVSSMDRYTYNRSQSTLTGADTP